jgi:hypothetical protein
VAIEAQEILALTLIFVVHVAGGVMLVWGMFGGDARPRPPWRRRDDGPGDPSPGPRPTPPSQHRRPLPLPGSWPSDVRLRDHTPLRDAHPRPPRRPSRTPQPARSPQRR